MQAMVKSLRDGLGDDVCGPGFIFAEAQAGPRDDGTLVGWSRKRGEQLFARVSVGQARLVVHTTKRKAPLGQQGLGYLIECAIERPITLPTRA